MTEINNWESSQLNVFRYKNHSIEWKRKQEQNEKKTVHLFMK
ncbi:hypothetical protein RV09_GL002657 [Enterococcus moraviensis]|nr:hypothetical protein RV09_GL002657 [Enterococcus moraviensis]